MTSKWIDHARVNNLGTCYRCGADPSSPCRTPGRAIRGPHRGRQSQPFLVTCETGAAICRHARVVTDDTPIRLGGHSKDVRTLCGDRVGWDLGTFVGVTCRACLVEMEKRHG